MKFRVSKKEFEAKIGIPLVSDIEFEGEPVEEKCFPLEGCGCVVCKSLRYQPKQVEDSKKGGINGCYCVGQPCVHSKAPTENKTTCVYGDCKTPQDKCQGYFEPKEIEKILLKPSESSVVDILLADKLNLVICVVNRLSHERK